jgi:hypothetical protein
VRRLPAYELSVSWELEALEAAVREIITQAAAADRSDAGP